MLDHHLTLEEATAFYHKNFETMSPEQEDEIMAIIRELEDAPEPEDDDPELTAREEMYDLRHARSCAVPSRI